MPRFIEQAVEKAKRASAKVGRILKRARPVLHTATTIAAEMTTSVPFLHPAIVVLREVIDFFKEAREIQTHVAVLSQHCQALLRVLNAAPTSVLELQLIQEQTDNLHHHLLEMRGFLNGSRDALLGTFTAPQTRDRVQRWEEILEEKLQTLDLVVKMQIAALGIQAVNLESQAQIVRKELVERTRVVLYCPAW
ncbi:hypothetical protein Clacol_008927 [Clathrus columnatus]|uniref:Uncharacterized protein n=1 Tax=Clathrus columnatus TaxID=1419009 RepID=A0AAV5AQK3_9AGAM|nr:hypothetical protein Clacol_008927 [Clathrus columnatus]